LRKTIFILIFTSLGFLLVIYGCRNNNLKTIANLPELVREVSGTEIVKNHDNFWMINDAGNESILFELNSKGKLVKTIRINATNNDWEELTSDDKGNLYIGDFGNNKNKRQDLCILKIKNEDLKNNDTIGVEYIKFKYPEQKNFPPKKKKFFYDCEAFFYLNDSFYLFTKSRVEGKYGQTTLYKIPAIPGDYTAEKISYYQSNYNNITCWITSADISPDKTKVALLSPSKILLFTNFKDNNFLEGKVTEIKFDFVTQKESLFFKDNNTLYLTDEYAYGLGRNLYQYILD